MTQHTQIHRALVPEFFVLSRWLDFHNQSKKKRKI